jgi:hypothetical protein
VEAIGHLDRVWRTLAGTVSVRAATVAADHLRAAVHDEPGRERLGRAVGEEVDRPMGPQIDQDRDVVVAAPQGEIVDAEHGWSDDDRLAHGADQPNQGRSARVDPPPRREAGTRSPADGHPHIEQQPVERHGPPAGARRQHRRLLRERPARARPPGAPEPSHLQVNGDRPTADGLVGDPTNVAAVHPSRAPTARRTAGTRSPWRHRERDRLRLNDHLEEAQPAQVLKNRRQTHWNLAPHAGPSQSGEVASLWSIHRLPSTESVPEPMTPAISPATGSMSLAIYTRYPSELSAASRRVLPWTSSTAWAKVGRVNASATTCGSPTTSGAGVGGTLPPEDARD